MKHALIVHGYYTKNEYSDADRPTPSNDHWLPWLSKQLVTAGIFTVAVEMPEPYQPDYAAWKCELERYDIDEETVLVGHSCGGGFLVRWLSETDKKVGKVVLVAPWLGYEFDSLEGDFTTAFFDFVIDPTLAEKTRGLTVMYSTDDMEAVQKSVANLRQQVKGVEYRVFTDKRHFTRRSLGGEVFPELSDAILG